MRTTLVLLSALVFKLAAQPYNGTAVGTLTYVTGAHANGLQGTNASSSHFTIPSGATNFSGDFSVGIKFREDAPRDGYTSLFETTGLQCQIFGYSGSVYCVVDNSGVAINTSTTDVSDGSWHEISMRRTGSSFSIFIDGTANNLWVGGTNTSSTTTTVSTVNLGTAAAAFLAVPTLGSPSRTNTRHDEISIWTTGSPSACNPCSGGETGLRALYHLNDNLLDEKTSDPLAAGTLSSGIGLKVTVATNGGSPYSYLLRTGTPISGACSGVTYADSGAALTSQTSFALFARDTATLACWVVVVTDTASTTATSNAVLAPATGNVMRSY